MLGLVTSETKVLTRYGDQAWMGVQLSPDKAGKEWCSRNPTFVVESVEELVRLREEQRWIPVEEKLPEFDAEKMWDALNCLPDVVEHFVHGDPDDADSVTASAAVKWAIDEITRLREERLQREALWQVCAKHTRDIYGNVFVPKPLPPGPEAKEVGSE